MHTFGQHSPPEYSTFDSRIYGSQIISCLISEFFSGAIARRSLDSNPVWQCSHRRSSTSLLRTLSTANWRSNRSSLHSAVRSSSVSVHHRTRAFSFSRSSYRRGAIAPSYVHVSAYICL
jgi:hypothetical protein